MDETQGGRFRRGLRRKNPTVAVVGLGYWGPNLLRVLIERTDVEVRWMCDSDESRMVRLMRRYPNVKPTTELDDVLDDPEVDGIPLATASTRSRSCGTSFAAR